MNAPHGGIDLAGLDRARFARLEQILDEVLDLPVGEIPAALNRLCAGDPGLRAQAAALLAADTAAGDFLAKPAIESVAGLMRPIAGSAESPPDTTRDGERLGPYRIVREIARGGMGTVFLAERADGAFEQTVAIKLIKRGLDTDEIVQRFLRERQILARLEHPNIARLLDGGVTGDGLPWFALEYVEGTPITQHCERRDESLRSTLRLFVQAGRAVQFAHQSLVVHRDLKPANILVSDRGEVKLLDFGIAKLLEQGAEEGEQTLGSLHLMTPVYAAPEQVRGEPPTTATDVYALGVVLYELLTGERAYRKPTGTPSEIRQAILEETPEAPSARLGRGSSGPHRAGWAQAVRGDLDNIVLQALRKEPERRYASAEALIDDIERHLAGRPVRASGRRFLYIAQKVALRNRVPIVAVAALLASLATGLVVTMRERDRARLETRNAQQMKDFAIDLFQVSDPLQRERGDKITARELLDRGALRVERELKGQPAVQAEMWSLLGNIYRNLGLFPQAVRLHERALAARRAAGEQDSLIATTLDDLGQSLLEQGDYPRGERALGQAVTIRRRIFGEVSPQTAHSMSQMAVLLNRSGRTAQAESLLRRVVAIDSVTLGIENESTASDILDLGMNLYYGARYDEALPLLRRALEIRGRVLGQNHPDTATGMDDVASCLAGLGDLDSALVLRRAALAIRQQWFAPEHPDLAHSYNNLGGLYWQMGRYAEGEESYRKALAIREKLLDPKDPFLGQTHNDLATCFYLHGLRDSAEAHFRAAIAIWNGSLPPTHRFILTARNNLGAVLREEGEYPESEALLRDVLAARVRTLGPNDLDVAQTSYNLGKLLALETRRAEAEVLLRRALTIRTEKLGAEHPKVAESEETLASFYRDGRRDRESAELYDSALAICRARFSGPNPQTADALVGKGRLLLLTGRPQGAEPLLREGLGIRAGALRPGDPRIAEAQAALGICLAELGRAGEARPLLLRSIPILQGRPGARDPLIAQAGAALARLNARP